MTDTAEQRSEPTPGDWKVRGNPEDGFPPDIVAESGRGEFGRDIIARIFDSVPRFNGTLEEIWANARLLAASKDTAAERDNLKAANVELVTALKVFVTAWEALPRPRHYSPAEVGLWINGNMKSAIETTLAALAKHGDQS